MRSYILICMAMESWTLSLFMAWPRSVLEATRYVQNGVHNIRGRNRRGKNNRTTSFGEKGLFVCGHICLCKQLLPQINSCCQKVMQNNEMISHGPTIV